MQALPPPPCMIICRGRANESCLWFVSCSCVSFLSCLCSFVVTTSRLHGLLHQLVCFRRLPWALIPNTTQRPRCRKFGSVVPLNSAFSKPHGRRWRASRCVNGTGRDRVGSNPVCHELHGQRSTERWKGGFG